ncbi:MAG: YHYH protein [Thalassobaculales bacterium]
MRAAWSPFAVMMLLAAGGAAGHEIDPRRLPVGDGRVAAEPRRGAVFACRQHFDAGAPGAQARGPWLKADGSFDPAAKVFVEGSISHRWTLTIRREGPVLRILGNGLPSHATGAFPVDPGSQAARYDRNPNQIRAQAIDLSLPAEPRVAPRPFCLPMGPIGITVTGVLLFNALDARGQDAQAHEVQDRCHGHPQQSGVYHYHGLSPCLPDARDAGGHSLLIGHALDGFGIYGPHGSGGRHLTTADLDECHGHVGPVTWHGATTTIYHYHATIDFPYTLGCFRGEPVRTALGAGPPGAGPPGSGPPGGGPPPPRGAGGGWRGPPPR